MITKTSRKIKKIIVNPFLHVCNFSFLKGMFPDAINIARVIPLSKSGDNCFY